MSVSFLRSLIYGSTNDTTTDNSTTTLASSTIAAGTVTLSVTNTDDDDNDDTPPAFPSLNSIQRSEPSVSRSYNNKAVKRDAGLMPPPSTLPPSRQSDTQINSSTIPNRLSAYDSRSAASSSLSVSGLRVPSSSNSLQLPPSTIKPPTLTPKQRQKVALAPGHSTLDWAALKSSGRDLRVCSVLFFD